MPFGAQKVTEKERCDPKPLLGNRAIIRLFSQFSREAFAYKIHTRNEKFADLL